jgi:hypothetical protein
MVKNTTGGNKSKGMSRKGFTKKEGALRVAREEGEIYAQAIKVMGGNIASAIDIDGDTLRVHIRGKFRGRGKRDNFIGPSTWLLVGLHSWSSEPKPGEIRDCDVLEVYNDADKNRLTSSITAVNWTKFIYNDSKTLGAEDAGDDGGIKFDDDDTHEYEELFASQATGKVSGTLIMDDGEIIDYDDI